MIVVCVAGGLFGGPAGAAPAQTAWPFKIRDISRWFAMPNVLHLADGAVGFDYGDRYQGAGVVFNAVTTSLYCLDAYEEARLGSRLGRRDALRAASALARRATVVGNGLGFRYPFPAPIFKIERGWVSGMAQGLAMACEAAAYNLGAGRGALKTAAAFYRVLVAPYGSNGTATPFGSGTFYEEVAGRPGPPDHILNGMMFALAGLWFTQQIDPQPGYLRAFTSGADAVRSVIDQYDGPGASLYDQGLSVAASINGYNLVHVFQLRWLAEKTGDIGLLVKAVKFSAFQHRIDFTPFVAFAGAPKGTKARPGGFFTPLKTPVTMTATFRGSERFDHVQIFTAANSRPAESVTVRAGSRSVTVHPDGRLLDIAIQASGVSTATITFVPRKGASIGVALVTFSSAVTRSLGAVPSDASSVTGTQYLYDGNAKTTWNTVGTHPTLTLGIGDGVYDHLTTQRCSGGGPFTFSFSPDLSHWTPAVPADESAPAGIPVIPGMQYIRLQ